MTLRVGVISDTHGLLRPEALRALAGSDHIVHAGDIGSADILDALREIAPITAVRGNNDVAPWAMQVPDTAAVLLGGVKVYVLHDAKTLALDAAAAGYAVVIAGHSHRPRIERVGAVLHVNPGSAGPRRFSLPVTVGHLEIAAGRVAARIEELALSPARKAEARGARRA